MNQSNYVQLTDAIFRMANELTGLSMRSEADKKKAEKISLELSLASAGLHETLVQEDEYHVRKLMQRVYGEIAPDMPSGLSDEEVAEAIVEQTFFRLQEAKKEKLCKWIAENKSRAHKIAQDVI